MTVAEVGATAAGSAGRTPDTVWGAGSLSQLGETCARPARAG